MSLESLRDFVKEIEKDEKNSHGYRAHASFLMLEHVDLMISRFQMEKNSDRGAILLNVFGLLQGFFVGIDALYDLSIGLTRYKYPVNINQNEALHELKYIRNDIVGHPTHRTYPNGGMGFSILETKDLTIEKLSYKTYIYEKNDLRIQTKDVHFKPLIENYQKEKRNVIEDIERYVKRQTKETDIPERIAVLYETMNLGALDEIIKAFRDTYTIEESSSHRFLWRAELIRKLINWEEMDQELKDIVFYITKVQLAKLYDIALDMEERHQKSLYTAIPKLLQAFYKFVRRHEEEVYPLLKNINDAGHPLHHADIDAILKFGPSSDASKLLHFLIEQEDSDKRFLIGSILRAYRKKS
ncbi:MAG: hypothetical protein EOM23_10655 [Candidatus Moranbacteria bacterium]|nr:hypothetical protein [Candidatus Moranbacteria bacterium]